MNDGSELTELFQVNIAEAARAKTSIKLKDAQNVDLARQLRDSFSLLREARDLLEITALESPLRRDILELNLRIDEFYPQGD